MFKKCTTMQSPFDIRQEMQHKAINHEFFLLVRDQKYQQAYTVGMMYLKFNPENNSIRQFCEFIQGNRQELIKMVSDENDYTDGSSDEEQDQEDSESDSENQDQKSVISQTSLSNSDKSSLTSKSSTRIKSIKSSPSPPPPQNSAKTINGKENSKLCQFHKWDHKCKNEVCPNKKKK